VAEGEASLNGEKLRDGDGAALSGEDTVELATGGEAQVLLFVLN
jgi:hypothetical protein